MAQINCKLLGPLEISEAAGRFFKDHTNGSGTHVLIDTQSTQRTMPHSDGQPGKLITFWLVDRSGKTSTLLEEALLLTEQGARELIRELIDRDKHVFHAVGTAHAWLSHVRDGGPRERPGEEE